MSAPVDTSAEAVMHLVGMLPDWRGEGPCEALDAALTEAAAMLRALLRERDEARRDRDDWKRSAYAATDGEEIAISNLDAAEAALATARADALREAADRMFKAASDAIAHVGHMNSASREAEARRHVHETYAAIIEKEPRA